MNHDRDDDFEFPNHETCERLLAEALLKTPEEVAASLVAKGYDLDELDRQLIALINAVPPYRA